MSIEVVTAKLGMIETNCYLVIDTATGEGAVIDPGDSTAELESLIKNKNIKEIKYILLTHGHYDHILGVPLLKELTGAKVAIHALDADCLIHPEKSRAGLHFLQQQSITPDILLNDADELTLGKTKIKVMHTPGHTKGGVCYIIESDKTIFSGDTLFYRTVGRTDLGGGDFNTIISSVQKLASLSGDYKVYPGHERATTLCDERKHNKYLRGFV